MVTVYATGTPVITLSGHIVKTKQNLSKFPMFVGLVTVNKPAADKPVVL
jgi:hypothetical protein